jgi:uncharacterized protein
MQSIIIFSLIGLFAGLTAGVFGLGGGLIIIPALVYVAGFSQFTATGTSLAVMLPPIGIAATIEYCRRGHVNLKAAMIIAACLILGSWLSARMTRKFNELYLRLAFGIFLSVIGLLVVFSTWRKIKS